MTEGTILTVLKDQIEARQQRVYEWFAAEFARTPPSFYSSVDIRHSGHKLVPVDTNLFPAGFNNLSQAARARAVFQIGRFIAGLHRPVHKVLVIPENHTRNLGYLDNLRALTGLFVQAGLEVRLGSLAAEIGAPVEVADSQGGVMIQRPLTKRGNTLATEDGFIPDLIVVNNDMTSGSPEILKGVTQVIVPQIGQGWYRRKKTIHFEAYGRVAQQFANLLDLDPWLIHAQFHQCGRINFHERIGIECVALGVEKVLSRVREKYREYGIADDPYVFIKADSGTYGMGIMTARSGDEVMEINKNTRKKMGAIKEGVASSEVIIQEGIPTIDRIDGLMAEPMLYLVNGEHVGGAYRVNDERDQYSNLNAKGMHFKGMCDEAEGKPDAAQMKGCNFMVLGTIAKLATLAAAREEYGEDYTI